ncbi:MAG: O-antigen ligase family protein, partial [Odoribacter sp.]|nr:O-antigen ligase family protein [Odoribacter sp.]
VFSLYRKGDWKFHWADFLFLLLVGWYGWRLSAGKEVADDRIVTRSMGCFLLYFYFRREHPGDCFWGLLFGAGILRAIWGISHFLFFSPALPFWLSGNGGFGNSALWGIFSVLALLAGGMIYGHCRKPAVKWMWGIGMALLLLAVFLSASRASWVALAVGCIWLVRFSEQGKTIAGYLHRRYAGIPLLLCWIIVCICACGVAYGLYALRPASVEGRFLIWLVIAGAIENAPWVGHGALSASYMPLQAEWFARHPDAACAMLADNNVHAFNEPLRILFECGTIGLLLFLGTLAVAFRTAVQGDRSARGASGLLVAVMCFGLFGYPLTAVPIAVVAVIALAIMISGENGKGRLPDVTFSRIGRGAIVTVLVCFLAFCTEQFVRGKRADRLLLQARTKPAILSDGELARCYQQWQGNPDFVLCYGKTLYDHERYAEALPVLRRGACLKPSSQLLCDLGDCYRFGGDLEGAVASYRLAARMTPARILPHYRLFCLYRDEGLETEAEEQAHRLLDMPVKVVNTSVLRYRHQARLFLSNRQSSNHKQP